MRGAEALQRSLLASGVDTCFMNPGTSEMHFVAALDDVPEMRAVLTLFEGVATGAADGFARMAGRPAAALVHLGPGLGNGLANLHNARRAGSPLVAIVGDHALTHKAYDSPLDSDIDTLARNPSGWVRRSAGVADVGRDAVDAVAAALGPPGCVATLILPADISWSDGAAPAQAHPVTGPHPVPDDRINEIVGVLGSGEPVAFLLGGTTLSDVTPLLDAHRVAAASGARLLAETFPARMVRGGGLPSVDRLGYRAEWAAGQLAGVRHLVLVEARRPVASFAYPEQASDLVPPGCTVHVLTEAGDDSTAALAELAARLGAPAFTPAGSEPLRPVPTGALTTQSLASVIGAALPEGVVVSDEAQTLGLRIPRRTTGSPRHDWLCLTGGAIGQGLPLALGAAIACPDRPVLALQADGSSLYTIQSLWTMAREGLDTTVVLLSNGSYAILEEELARVGAEAGQRSRAMLDLTRPDLDFVSMANGFGVPATRVADTDGMAGALKHTFSESGPHLIEVRAQQ